MEPLLERELGAFSARITALEQDLRDLRSDVREIRDALVTVRGGWKALTLIVGVSASLGAAFAKLMPVLIR